VVELDRDLAARLRKRPELTVIESDVLKIDFREVARLARATYGEAHKLRVVGNLPYNISSPILFHLLDFVDVVQDQHFMLQKEVVDRMAASPGRKDFGRLSVMLQWRYDIESLIEVPPECFDPPPRVNSAVVRMTPLRHPPAVDVALLSFRDDLLRRFDKIRQRSPLLSFLIGQLPLFHMLHILLCLKMPVGSGLFSHVQPIISLTYEFTTNLSHLGRFFKGNFTLYLSKALAGCNFCTKSGAEYQRFR